MRVAHIADQHFDRSSRWEECLFIANWIVEDLRERKPDLITLGGDIFERASNPEERNAAGRWLIQLAEIAEVVGVYGNHEKLGDLDLFNQLESDNPITFYDRPTIHAPRLGNAKIACLPWPRKASLIAMLGNVDRERTSEEALEKLQSIFRDFGVQMANETGPKVFLGHVMVSGSVTSTGQPLVGADFEVGLADLGLARAHFYALGHIHKGQDWLINGAPCVYPGSPRRTAFGETEEKGYILVEFKYGKGDQVYERLANGARLTIDTVPIPKWRARWQRIPTPCAPMLLLEYEYVPGGEVTFNRPTEDVKEAEIRLRYRVPADHREAAKMAALHLRDEMLLDGAIDVKVEEIVIATSRARAPEITEALTLEDKLPILWKSRSDVPDPLHQAGMFQVLADLQIEALHDGVVSSSSATRGTLRLKGVSGKGFIPYPDPFAVDFERLGRLTAIIGGNGSGKSTLVELIGSALIPLHSRFLTTPTRGPLKDITVARDAFVEVRFDRGGAFVVRHAIDGFNGKVTSSVTLDGQALLEKAQVQEYLAWASKNLPAPPVFYNTILRPQKSPGLVGMSAGDRKSLILKVLDLEYVEELAERARKRQREAEAAVSTARARLSEVGALEDGAFHQVLSSVADLMEELAKAQAEVTAKEEALALARRDAEIVAKAIREYQQAKREQAALELERDRLTRKQTDLDERLRNNNALLANEDEINAAVAELDRLHQYEAELVKQERELTTEDTHLRGINIEIRGRFNTLAQRRGEIQRRLAQAEQVLLSADMVNAAATSLPGLEERVSAARRSHNDALEALDAFRTEATATNGSRIDGLRGGLRHIAEGGTSTPEAYAAGTLEEDESALAQQHEHPARLLSLKDAVTQAAALDNSLVQEVASLQMVASRLGEIQRAEASKTEAVELESAAAEEHAALLEEDKAVNADIEAVTENLRECFGLQRSNREQITAVESATKNAPALAQAKTRIAELERQQQEVAGEMETVVLALAELPELAAEEPKPYDVETPAVAAQVAAQHAGRVETELRLAERALEDARAKESRRQELAAEITELNYRVSVTTRLALDLGKDGIQALEISAAGPTLTTLANDLLRSCGDNLFSCSVETSKLDSTGKREIEGCPIWVYNSVKGTTQEANTLSGGEEVFIGEALSLALTMMACNRAGIQSPLLIRDETGAALDPARTPMYVAMMRRVCDLLDAKLIFVSHSQAAHELADSRILIEGGKVTVI